MKNTFRTLLLAVAMVPLGACQTSTITMFPSGGGGGGGGGGNPNGPLIQATIMDIKTASLPAPFNDLRSCQVQITSNVGASVTITSATLIAPGSSPVLLTASGSDTYSDNAGAGWTYQAGQNYSVQVVMWGQTYIATVLAPGGVGIPATGVAGPVTWSTPGTPGMDSVAVDGNTVPGATTSGSLNTGSATYFPTPGVTYSISVYLAKLVNGAFGSQAYTGSSMTIVLSDTVSYTR